MALWDTNGALKVAGLQRYRTAAARRHGRMVCILMLSYRVKQSKGDIAEVVLKAVDDDLPELLDRLDLGC